MRLSPLETRLAGLDQIAAEVRVIGHHPVNGNVVVDDRLFTPYNGFPDGLITPIWVNENLVDAVVTPGAVGQAASVSWRPMTAAYTVANQVITVIANGSTSLQIIEPTPGQPGRDGANRRRQLLRHWSCTRSTTRRRSPGQRLSRPCSKPA